MSSHIGRSFRLLSSGLLVAVLATAATSAQERTYSLVDLTPPVAGPLLFRPYIGNAGQIAVTTATPSSSGAAYLRNQQGNFIELESLPGASYNVASFIGRNGLPVGSSGTSFDGTEGRAAIWDRWGYVTDLGVLPGDTFAAAMDANQTTQPMVNAASIETTFFA